MSDDLISREAAIDSLKEHRALYCDNTPDAFSKLSYAEKSRVDELDTAIATLVNLPSAQPEPTYCYYCHEDSDGFVYALEKNGHAVIHGNKLMLAAKGWRGEVDIKYCPMRGRRLER